MPIKDWFSPPPEKGEGDDRPVLPGVFGFLDDLLGSIRETFEGWRDNLFAAEGSDEELAPAASTDWVDLGRLLHAATGAFHDADEELIDEEGYGGYEAATAFDEEPPDLYFEPPEGDGWGERKTFASYLDVMAYMADIWHLEHMVVYHDGLYTIYIRDSK